MNKGLRILYLVTEDWYFWSHRLGLARAARDAGYEVIVGTRCNTRRADLEHEGFTVVDIPFERSLRAPRRDLAALWAVRRLVRDAAPDVVHLVAMKPLLLGGLALTGLDDVNVVCAFTGLGYVFSSQDRLARVIRPLLLALLRRLARRPRSLVLTQNNADLDTLLRAGVGERARSRVIPGSGIDLAEFQFKPPRQDAAPLVLLPARVLRDKGVFEFVSAARSLKEKRPQARFVLAGAHDVDNPAAVSREQIEDWVNEGVVEWLGHCTDMQALYHAATVVCLPSYREGLPKALLEAAACGRALVATDVPGCREICINNETGVLVPPRDAHRLATAIENLLLDPQRQAEYGRAGRALVEARFALPTVATQTLDLYAGMLDRNVVASKTGS